jgi:hypothetical protein
MRQAENASSDNRYIDVPHENSGKQGSGIRAEGSENSWLADP